MSTKTTLFFFFVILTSFSIISSEDKVFCHIYGDPHLIVFNQSHEQYWCRTSGSLTLLSNDFLRIRIQIQNETWTINRYEIEFYKNNATIPCQINHEDQRCDASGIDVIITRPNLNQISVLYREENIHLSIFEQKSWYDLSIRMPESLVDQSIGLCIEPSENECEPEYQSSVSSNRSQEICQQYSNASIQLSTRLNFVNNSQQIQDAFRACVNDYETTGDYHFGISGVQMIVQNGFHNRQLNDSEFELQTLLNVPTIESILLNATNNIALLLTTTVSPSTIISTSVDSITSNSISSSTSSATSTSSPTTSPTSTSGSTTSATFAPGPTTHSESLVTTTTNPTWSTRQSTTTTTTSMAVMIHDGIGFVLINAILLVAYQNFN